MEKKKKIAEVMWFTGLSGSGKSTLSNKIYKKLKRKGFKIKKIDGDSFRKKNKSSKNFSKNNIIKNNLSIIKEIKKVRFNYDFILVSVISPLLSTRKLAKKVFKNKYIEIYVFCKIKTLIKRDTKGLYKKAIKKEINNLIGFKSKIKYENSKYKIIKIDTDKLSARDSVNKILRLIHK